MSIMTFEQEDEDIWFVEDVHVSASRPPLRITVHKEGSQPTDEEVIQIQKVLADVEHLILRSSELILDNYGLRSS